MKLITAKEAKALLAASEQRKTAIIELMNEEIKRKAAQGLTWAPFPSGLHEDERTFLEGELMVAGFDLKGTDMAYWK